jgi:hypothetical protein
LCHQKAPLLWQANLKLFGRPPQNDTTFTGSAGHIRIAALLELIGGLGEVGVIPRLLPGR